MRREQRRELLKSTRLRCGITARPDEYDAQRLLFARTIEWRDLPRRESPRIAELVEAQLALDEHQRIFGDELAISLIDLIEERDFHPPSAIVEYDRITITALAQLVHVTGDRRRAPPKETTLGRAAGGSIADEIGNAPGDEPREIFFRR